MRPAWWPLSENEDQTKNRLDAFAVRCADVAEFLPSSLEEALIIAARVATRLKTVEESNKATSANQAELDRVKSLSEVLTKERKEERAKRRERRLR